MQHMQNSAMQPDEACAFVTYITVPPVINLGFIYLDVPISISVYLHNFVLREINL